MNSKVRNIKVQHILETHSKIRSQKKLEEIYEDYKKGIYYVSTRYSSVHLSTEELWTSTAHDRSWLFRHHCLPGVAYLIDSYYLDYNQDKLHTAYKMIEKWYEMNYPVSLSIMGWHDHSTALRLLHIVKLYLVLEEKNDSDVLPRLAEIADKHMEKLSDPDFYMPKHNHGLDQDICLFIATSVITDLPKSAEWNKLALERFWGQVNHIFASDGSYLEHSPHYIYLMLDRLLNFYQILNLVDEEQGEVLRNRITKIATFFIYSLHPDGNFPTIGDSETNSFTLNKEYWSILPEQIISSLNAIKNHNAIDIDLPVDAFYKEGGYAFFRSDWNNNENTVQLAFCSAFHSRVHKHHDDLSFVLYGKGQPLLIDSGKFTYQYDRDERKYVISSYGHNTVRINDQETNLSRQNFEKSGVLSFLSTKNVGYSSGFHALVDGVIHRRIMIYLKPKDVIVIDVVKGSSETTGEIIFNVNPDLIIVPENGEQVAYKDREVAFYLKNLLGNNEFTKYRGQTTPLRGWSSKIYGEFQGNDQLAMQKKGNCIKFAHHIRLNQANHITDFTFEGDLISFSWKKSHIKIQLTDFYEAIFINDKFYKTEKYFNNTKLIESLVKNEAEYYKSIHS